MVRAKGSRNAQCREESRPRPLDRRPLRAKLKALREASQGTQELGLAPQGDPGLPILRLNGESVCVLHVSPAHTVRHLKSFIEAPSGVSAGRQSLVCCGNVLLDDVTVGELGLSAGTAIYLVVVELQWHPTIHGRHAEVSIDGRVARRPQGNKHFFNAIVVSCTPSRSFRVKVLETNERWSGSLELGFSEMRPEQMPSPLPHNLCDMPSTFAGSTTTCWNEALVAGDIVEISLQGDGCSLQIVVNDQAFKCSNDNHGRIAGDVFPVAGLYGRTVAIELLGDT